MNLLAHGETNVDVFTHVGSFVKTHVKTHVRLHATDTRGEHAYMRRVVTGDGRDGTETKRRACRNDKEDFRIISGNSVLA